MSKSNPKLGDLVHVIVDPRSNRGGLVCAAHIVGFPVTDEDDDRKLVDLKLILNSDEDRLLRDVELLDSRPEDDDSEEDAVAPLGYVAFWP